MSGRPRILVVEDDAPLAHLYCTALTMNGLSVMRAADTRTGLPHARAVIQKPADPDYFVQIVARHLPSATT